VRGETLLQKSRLPSEDNQPKNKTKIMRRDVKQNNAYT
jgi:hypothetical protein